MGVLSPADSSAQSHQCPVTSNLERVTPKFERWLVGALRVDAVGDLEIRREDPAISWRFRPPPVPLCRLGGYWRNRPRSLGIQRGSQVMMVTVAAKLPIVTKKAPG
ncbi:hypothetical protein TPA0598_13_00570 [Streptomyces lydicamycinicus]|uniref:Uncharacterized protein n=1 Tax=Streptomyces lydicamycinicus TaxID=1546107 RepID=A0A0P4RGJ0_9ACTN|nr:hypothetical protein TPA0598_13_00570 [Streptomyces lydicamycinicus]